MLGEWGVWAQRPLLVGHGSNDRKTAEKKHKQRLDFNPAKIKVSDNSAAMVSAHGTKTALWISASWNDSIECQIWPNRPIPSAHSLSLHVDLPSPHEFLRQPRKPGLRTTIHKVKPRHGRATDAEVSVRRVLKSKGHLNQSKGFWVFLCWTLKSDAFLVFLVHYFKFLEWQVWWACLSLHPPTRFVSFAAKRPLPQASRRSRPLRKLTARMRECTALAHEKI